MDMKFEVAVLPVADVDRSKAFYQGLGWRLDADINVAEDYRVVQFTPPNSPASIQFGKGITTMTPGSVQNLMLIVEDVQAARDELISHGADVSEVFHGAGLNVERRVPGPDPERQSYRSFATFADPDGTATCCRRSRSGSRAGCGRRTLRPWPGSCMRRPSITARLRR